MLNRTNISSGAPWEEHVGYSRAVKIGNHIEISGTVAIKDGQIVGPGDPYLQTKRILEIIEEVLSQAGAGLNDVIRTRMYVTDIGNFEEIGRAHGEVFRDILPATSMVEVNGFVEAEYLVEIEATAILSSE